MNELYVKAVLFKYALSSCATQMGLITPLIAPQFRRTLLCAPACSPAHNSAKPLRAMTNRIRLFATVNRLFFNRSVVKKVLI